MPMTITTAEAQDKFPDLINEVIHNKEHIILTRRGKEIAAIITLEDLHLLQQFKDKNDLQEAVEALKEAREQGSMTIEQVKDEIGN
jgi:antitoxin Phd